MNIEFGLYTLPIVSYKDYTHKLYSVGKTKNNYDM